MKGTQAPGAKQALFHGRGSQIDRFLSLVLMDTAKAYSFSNLLILQGMLYVLCRENLASRFYRDVKQGNGAWAAVEMSLIRSYQNNFSKIILSYDAS